jgi:RNA polymerase sigma-70 factor, ECF subfamily
MSNPADPPPEIITALPPPPLAEPAVEDIVVPLAIPASAISADTPASSAMHENPQAKFDSWYGELFPKLVACVIASSRLPAAVAEEIVQDVGVELWRLTVKDGAIPQRGTAFARTKWRALDHLRKSGNTREVPLSTLSSGSDEESEIDLLDKLFAQAHAGTPENDAAQNELLARLKTALSHLPEKERTIIRLRFVEDLTWEEIAQITGYSVPTLRKKYLTTRNHLRKLIDPRP